MGSRGHSPLTERGRGRSEILGLCGGLGQILRLIVNEPREGREFGG